MPRRSTKEERMLIAAVNNLKNHTADMITATHGIAFTVFFIVEKLLDYYLYPLLPEGGLRVLLIAVIAAVLYPCIYTFIKWLCDVFIDQTKKQYDIQGIWYHVHIPHILGDVDYGRNMLRCGQTVIKRELYDFTFSATNFNYCVRDGKVVRSGDLNETTWHTLISEISDTNEREYDIIQIYNAKTSAAVNMDITACPCCRNQFDTPVRIREAEQNRYGVHKFTVDRTSYKRKEGYTRIKAEYSDCWPSLKTGELLLFKSEAERDACVAEYFQEQARLTGTPV